MLPVTRKIKPFENGNVFNNCRVKFKRPAKYHSLIKRA